MLMPRTRQYMYMGLSLPSLIALVTLEVLPPFEASNEATVKVDDDKETVKRVTESCEISE